MGENFLTRESNDEDDDDETTHKEKSPPYEEKNIKEEEENRQASASLEYSCYHCDDFQSTNTKYDYECHVIRKHQVSPSDVNHPCYPTKADIERLGLKAQGKDWEK